MTEATQEKRPVISLIASAARPENWMGLYESIGDNEVDFELVMVGPNPPKQDLPHNIIYVKSNVKPAQCAEIASRHANGQLLLMTADDMLFITDRPLDKLYALYVENKHDDIIVSCRYTNTTDDAHRFFQGNPDSVFLPMYGLISAELWRKIGGIDRRFIAVSWDTDIAMRVLALGGRVVLSDVYIDSDMETSDSPRSRGSALARDHKPTDRALVDRLWSVDGKNHFNRTLPVKPLSDVDILVKSQPPEGRWKYQNDIFNKFITSKLFFWLNTRQRITAGQIKRFRIDKIPYYLKKNFLRRT